MKVNTYKNKMLMFTLFTVLLLFTERGQAKIPEPGNILYGPMPSENSSITAKINGELITSYTRGDIVNAGENFVLRIPIDTMEPQEPGTARPGDVALLYFDDETVSATTVTIEEKGSVQRLFKPVSSPDSDGDGYSDADDNCPDIANADQKDANNNGIGDACDSASDTDGDGYNDQLETEYFNAGRLDLDGSSAYDPLIPNTPGDEGYTGSTQKKSSSLLLMMPAILSGANASR